MNFSQNSSLGGTPSAQLTWLKKLVYNRLKNRIIGNKHEYYLGGALPYWVILGMCGQNG